MGFIFPGDTSPHGTGFSYASRDWFPTTSQLHRAQSITAHLWVCSPESSRERGRHRSWSAHPPVTLLISLGSTQDEASAGLGCPGVIQHLSVTTPGSPPCPWGQSHSPYTDSTWFSLLNNVSKRNLISFP